MRAFAEVEIVIPSGPFAGRRFNGDRQPYTKLWFDAVDSGRWNRYVATGPTQSGKTLACFIIPLLYHLFEMGETVICGLPDMDMAADKWNQDLLPVIERSRYRDLLPRSGGGSRGGRVESVQFSNGATLKFMSGGGSDKSRAGFTSRVVVITETDGMDTPAAGSRESDKITQIEARTRAYGRRKRVYLECTVSTETGRTWREYIHGTQSRIVIRCPACKVYVTPEREHLSGHQDAVDVNQARRTGAFACPGCGQLWSEQERVDANHDCRLLHQGESIDAAGVISGTSMECDTLGFRWSAVNNLFLATGDLAADEWRAARMADEENADREMRQFVWAIPVQPTKLANVSVDITELSNRIGPLPRGIVPLETRWLTAAIDIGKYLCHWVVVAWSECATGFIVDYGRIEVASDGLGVEQATLIALREFRDLIRGGWPEGAVSGKAVVPGQVWVDAGYQTPVVYAFCKESGDRFRPSVGRGAAQQRMQWYNRPTQTGSIVKHIGEGYHANWLPAEQLLLFEADADYWKTWAHQRLTTPLGSAGAMVLFKPKVAQEHLSIAKHFSAEIKTEEFIAGKGVTTRWERIRKQNHWFDALYNACAAGHVCGVRLVKPQVEHLSRPEPRAPVGMTMPDGRPYFDHADIKRHWDRMFGR